METLNVKDLPEPLVKALEIVVQALRDHCNVESLPETQDTRIASDELPVWSGHVIGHLTREEIYDYVR